MSLFQGLTVLEGRNVFLMLLEDPPFNPNKTEGLATKGLIN